MKKFKLFFAMSAILLTSLVVMAQSDSTGVTIGSELTHENISQTYLAWFASPGMFLMLVIILTGMIAKLKSTLSGFAKQAISWILGIVLGIGGSILGFGMFAGLSILDAGILGLVSAGFSNVLYSTGAFNGILGIPKKQ